jgi:Family of unknown function (DUF6463)
MLKIAMPFIRHNIGLLVAVLGLLHQGVGVIFYGGALRDIAQAGFINSIIPPYWDRDAAFWFFMYGVMLIVYGAITHWALRQTGKLPAFFGWCLALSCLVGVVFMPSSGLWFGILLGGAMVRISRTC